MLMKKLLCLVAIAAMIMACSKKEQSGTGLTFEENFKYVAECCLDSTIPFKEYETNFEEFLDSIESFVLTDADADFRHQMRTMPILAMTHIISPMTDSVEISAITDRYEERCKDILYTWYVQQLTDTIENERCIILSITAALDELATPIRVGMSFANNSKDHPVMLIGLPQGTTDYGLMIFFIPENDEDEILFLSNDDFVMSDPSAEEQTIVTITSPEVEKWLMEYKELDIWYQNDGLTAVSVALKRFHEQYPAAKEWLME